MIPQTLNGIRALKVVLDIPWVGVWVANVELDAEVILPLVPMLANETPAVLIVGDQTLIGTIDPKGSSTFGDKASARVVGGRNGWGKTVPALHFNNPGGALLSSLVIATTGVSVGEAAVDPSPILLGENYARIEGPASSVFGARDWFVDLTTGTAIVASWPTLPANPLTTSVLDFDMGDKRAVLSSDSIVLPGTILADTRFNGKTYTVRSTRQIFDGSGNSCEAWCGDATGDRLVTVIGNIVSSFGALAGMKTYLYRFVSGPSEGKLILQGITPGAPDLNPIDQWTGVSGIQSRILPATEIVVGFAGGDVTQPFIVSYSPLGVPLGVDIAGGAFPLVPAPWATALVAALAAFASGLNPTTLAAQATALTTALGLLPPSATILTKAT